MLEISGLDFLSVASLSRIAVVFLPIDKRSLALGLPVSEWTPRDHAFEKGDILGLDAGFEVRHPRIAARVEEKVLNEDIVHAA